MACHAALSQSREARQPASAATLNQALDGNLCRCTGYRPIVDSCRVGPPLPACCLKPQTPSPEPSWPRCCLLPLWRSAPDVRLSTGSEAPAPIVMHLCMPVQELAACDLEDLCANAALPEFPAALKRYVEVRTVPS